MPIVGGQRTLLFGQLTANFFNDSAKEGNLAIGYRQMMPGGFNLGAWVGGAIRKSDMDNSFKRFSGGLEALSKNIDLRLNWYAPTSEARDTLPGFAEVILDGNQIYITGAQEVALKGIDGEIGFRLPTEYLNLDPNIFELRAYAGGYNYRHSNTVDDLKGVKGRLELRINDFLPPLPGSRLTAEYAVSRDSVRETRHEIGLRVRIPFNGGENGRSLASLSHQQRRMLDGIERETDVFTALTREPVEDALTGTDFDRVAYASPTFDITTTSNAAGDNSLIILNGDVRVDRYDGGQRLNANQTLQGGGSTIAVRGRRTGLVLPFTAPGAAGLITRTLIPYDPNDPNDLNDDVHGLTIEGSNSHVSAITIAGLGLRGTDPRDGYGINITNNNKNLFITNVEISDLRWGGIQVNYGNEVTIIGSDLVGIDLYGLQIYDQNIVNIFDTTFDGALSLFAPLNNHSQGAGIYIRGLEGGNTVTVTNSEFKDSSAALTVLGGSSPNTVSVTNTVISDINVLPTEARRAAIEIATNGGEFTFDNVTIANTGGDALQFYGSGDLTIRNSTFENIGVNPNPPTNDGNAISIFGSPKFWLSNTTFSGDIGGSILDFGSGVTEVLPDITGNVNNTTSLGGVVCEAAIGSFTGEIEISGVVLIDNSGGPPNCN